MKLPQSLSSRSLAASCAGWQRKSKAGLTSLQRVGRLGYTLIEVLAAGAIVSIGATAMVALSSSVMLQEEQSARVAVARNYQESMIRLWQLGLSPVQVQALMPALNQNAVLLQAIYGTPALVETGTTTVNGIAMETANCTVIVNSSQDPSKRLEGALYTLTAVRPQLPTSLRTSPP